MFTNRKEAGKQLAKTLEEYKNKDVIVYALPRGGVIVAAEIAKKIHTPLGLIIVRKIGHPHAPEYAIGAVAGNGHIVYNLEEVAFINELSHRSKDLEFEFFSNENKNWFRKKVEEEREEVKRRQELYLAGQEPINAKGKITIIVDDGVATGLTLKAAIEEVKHQEPKKIIIAVPVIPKEIAKEIKDEVDEIVALDIPEVFSGSVGSYYEYFPQVSDKEVISTLKSVNKPHYPQYI